MSRQDTCMCIHTHTHTHTPTRSTGQPTQNLEEFCNPCKQPGIVVDTRATKMNADRSIFENQLNNNVLDLKSSLGELLAFTANQSAKEIINYMTKL